MLHRRYDKSTSELQQHDLKSEEKTINEVENSKS